MQKKLYKSLGIRPFACDDDKVLKGCLKDTLL